MRVSSIRPAPVNSEIYRPPAADDPDLLALAKSIRKHGVREPLVISADRYIISGHRRHRAAQLVGQATVPVRMLRNVHSQNNRERFVELLREFNRQRVKSFDEVLKEELVSADPKEAHRRLREHRETKEVLVSNISLRKRNPRCRISEAKRPFLEAVQAILWKRKKFWPLSDRQIHYALLNAPPLIHASKPDSTYDNTKESYKALVDLLTRARLQTNVTPLRDAFEFLLGPLAEIGASPYGSGEPLIPWQAISDPTRPVVTWNVWDNVGAYLRKELDDFGKGYYRELMQSQPHHIEIVGEKNTVESIIRSVAADYCIPYTIGRGYCSLAPRYELAERFRKSGEQQLILLFLSDFDPDEEEIAHSFAQSLATDFNLAREIMPVQVALTAEQVEEYDLPPKMKAKKGSANYKRFVDRHGETVHELEALEPEQLQKLLIGAIDSVIDVDLFNQEVDKEAEDAAKLEATRNKMKTLLAGLVGGQQESEGGS